MARLGPDQGASLDRCAGRPFQVQPRRCSRGEAVASKKAPGLAQARRATAAMSLGLNCACRAIQGGYRASGPPFVARQHSCSRCPAADRRAQALSQAQVACCTPPFVGTRMQAGPQPPCSMQLGLHLPDPTSAAPAAECLFPPSLASRRRRRRLCRPARQTASARAHLIGSSLRPDTWNDDDLTSTLPAHAIRCSADSISMLYSRRPPSGRVLVR